MLGAVFASFSLCLDSLNASSDLPQSQGKGEEEAGVSQELGKSCPKNVSQNYPCQYLNEP